ncbi:hypothetical protein BDV28DRAFT_140590 [Aspergillus coremiiformis]|uniref:Uncharacterized protein n=1 Tax=Aspergillus coremiiformis TaxID=138285 RepID=A0A5N6YWB0_9EURO|nr:hypothetical protein BDV28DRAFT_140590 [Aspergillus coremiiformis]
MGKNPTRFVVIRKISRQMFEELDVGGNSLTFRPEYLPNLEITVLQLHMSALLHNMVTTLFKVLFEKQASSMGIPSTEYAFRQNTLHHSSDKDKEPGECFYPKLEVLKNDC